MTSVLASTFAHGVSQSEVNHLYLLFALFFAIWAAMPVIGFVRLFFTEDYYGEGMKMLRMLPEFIVAFLVTVIGCFVFSPSITLLFLRDFGLVFAGIVLLIILVTAANLGFRSAFANKRRRKVSPR